MTRTHIGLKPGASMSAGVRCGDTIYVSGQVAIDEAGALVGEGDIQAQAEQCFANIARILGEAGVGMADVVSLTTYLTAVENAGAFLKLRAQTFPERPPATTTVIAQLLHPSFLIEIQAVAVVAG
jgi:enamine deaminase RidA (YjgF/YER057c/UK114 family)